MKLKIMYTHQLSNSFQFRFVTIRNIELSLDTMYVKQYHTKLHFFFEKQLFQTYNNSYYTGIILIAFIYLKSDLIENKMCDKKLFEV